MYRPLNDFLHFMELKQFDLAAELARQEYAKARDEVEMLAELLDDMVYPVGGLPAVPVEDADKQPSILPLADIEVVHRETAKRRVRWATRWAEAKALRQGRIDLP